MSRLRSQFVAHFAVSIEHTLRSHITGVCMISVLVVAPFFPTLDVMPGTKDVQVFVVGIALPSTCPSKGLLGVGCPGCGMTR